MTRSTRRRRQVHGLVFIVDFLFIISFFVILDRSPTTTLIIRGKAPDEHMIVADAGDFARERVTGSFWRVPCDETRHAVCGRGQSIVIHGELFRLVGELFFIACAFENQVCSLTIVLNEDGLIDGSHFLTDNALGPKISATLIEKFAQHPNLIHGRDAQIETYMPH